MKYSRQIPALETTLEELQTTLTGQQETAASYRQMAEASHPEEIQNAGDPQRIEQMIKDVENQMKLERSAHRIRRPAAEIELEYEQLVAKHETAKKDLRKAQLDYTDLRLTSRARQQEWKQFRSKLGQRVNELFGRHLADMVSFTSLDPLLPWFLFVHSFIHPLDHLCSFSIIH